MRKLIFILLLFSTAQAQMTKHLLGPLPSYRGLHNGYKIPFLFHTPPDAVATMNGTGVIHKKYPIVIDFHGIGERTDSYATMASVDIGDLDDMYANGMPKYLRFTTSEYVGKRYAAPGRTDSTQFFYMFPQVWQGAAYVWLTYPYNCIKWVKDNYSHIVDTNRIYLTGLSFGGGAVWCAMQDTIISKQVAAAIPMCPGYWRYNGHSPDPFPGFKWIAEWGGLIIAAHSTNDEATGGSYITDQAVDSVMKYKGRTQLVYRQFTTGGHAGTWDRIINPGLTTNLWPLSNGQSIRFDIPFQSILLRYSTAGQRKKN